MEEEPHFVATVTGHKDHGTHIELETLDPDEMSNIIIEDGYEPTRKGELLTEEQKEKVGLWNRN